MTVEERWEYIPIAYESTDEFSVDVNGKSVSVTLAELIDCYRERESNRDAYEATRARLRERDA